MRYSISQVPRSIHSQFREESRIELKVWISVKDAEGESYSVTPYGKDREFLDSGGSRNGVVKIES
jgi:hypothetical protein